MLDVHEDPDVYEAVSLWYRECVERACSYPTGSFGYVFWWSLRYELYAAEYIEQWASDPAQAFKSWLLYLEFKWGQLEPHRRP